MPRKYQRGIQKVDQSPMEEEHRPKNWQLVTFEGDGWQDLWCYTINFLFCPGYHGNLDCN